MTYRVLLVPAAGPEDGDAIHLAAQMAARFAATARVVVAIQDLAYEMAALSPPGVILDSRLVQEAATNLEARKTGVFALAQRAAEAAGLVYGSGDGGGRLMVEESSPTPWRDLLDRLPTTDLVVMGATAANGAGPLGGAFVDVLINARAPVLVARGRTDPFGRTVAVAWDGGLPAARAVRSAWPLLSSAPEVVLLQDAKRIEPSRREAADLARAAAYFREHGVRTQPAKTMLGADDGPALVESARVVDAAVLVAGAYGHSRLREFVFGGATRRLLQAQDGPHLLLAH